MENSESYKMERLNARLSGWGLNSAQLSEVVSAFHDKRRFVFSGGDLHLVNQVLVDMCVGKFIGEWDSKHPVIEAIENRALELSDPNTLDSRMKRIEGILETLLSRTGTVEFGLAEDEIKLTATKEEEEILAAATLKVSEPVKRKMAYSVLEVAELKNTSIHSVYKAINSGKLETVGFNRPARVTWKSMQLWTPNPTPAKKKVITPMENTEAPETPIVESMVVEDLLDHVLNQQMFPESIPAPVYERPVFTLALPPIPEPSVKPRLKVGVIGDRGKRWIKPGLSFGNHQITFLDSDKLRQLNGNFDYIVLTGFHGHKATELIGDIPICRINTGNGIFTQVRTPNQLKNWLALHEKDMAN